MTKSPHKFKQWEKLVLLEQGYGHEVELGLAPGKTVGLETTQERL